ncbi:MAG: hypothetical protein IOB81_17060 [Burkholderia sp.]|nr:hypothetical protein [Burkholderia sp.]
MERRKFLLRTVGAALGAGLGPAVSFAQPAGTCKPLPHRSAVTTDIVFERTTTLVERTREQLIELLGRPPFLGSEDRVRISAIGGDGANHADVVADLTLPVQLTARDADRERWKLSPAEIKATERCRNEQFGTVRKKLAEVMRETPTTPFAVSPIFAALTALFPPGGQGPKTLVLISDAIENTSELRFYAPGGGDRLRVPQPAAVLAYLHERKLLPGLRGTKVLHVGFGLPGDSAIARPVRPAAEVDALRAVWAGVWKEVGVTNVDYGQPMPQSLM